MKSLLFWTGFLSQTLNYYLFFPDKFKLQPQGHKVTLLLSENKRRLLRWKLQHHFKKCEKNKITGSGIFFFFNSLNIFSNKKQMEEAYFPCYQLSGRLAALCCAAEAVVMAISAVVQDLQFGFFLTMTVMSWVGFFFFLLSCRLSYVAVLWSSAVTRQCRAEVEPAADGGAWSLMWHSEQAMMCRIFWVDLVFYVGPFLSLTSSGAVVHVDDYRKPF